MFAQKINIILLINDVNEKIEIKIDRSRRQFMTLTL